MIRAVLPASTRRLLEPRLPEWIEARWWDSPEYDKPKALRQANSKGRLILMDGVPA